MGEGGSLGAVETKSLPGREEDDKHRPSIKQRLMAGGQPFDAPLTAAKVYDWQKRRLGVLSPPGRRSTHSFDHLVPRRWARFTAFRDFDSQLTARRLVAPGMRKRTREGMRSPGYQTFCSHPEASGVLTRITMGLKRRL